MKHIPLHKIRERVDTGLEIRYYADDDKIRRDGDILGIHRDDHYIFFVVETGGGEILVDFNNVQLPAQSVYYMLPGQVHHRVRTNGAHGWFLAVDSALIQKDYRDIFEDQLLLQQPCHLPDNRFEDCIKVLSLLRDASNIESNEPFHLPMLYSLLNYFLGAAATCYHKNNGQQKCSSRINQIAHDFRKLLPDNFKTEKSPSAYAAMLNISGSYLNEAVNAVTGLPVSYWIIHEVMLEAKRLLYYTQLTVKEIAHQLGYDDHTYFSRLFKNAEDITPLAFRDSYRK